MGCATSGVAKTEASGEYVDIQNVMDENPEYPLQYIPETTKGELWDLEVNQDLQDRIDSMPPGTDGSYSSLLKYLSDGATKEIHHVIAIYLWMKSQDYESEALNQNGLDHPIQKGSSQRKSKGTRVDPNHEGPKDTPRGYMKMIKDGEGDFTTFFTILCRRSNIPCNVLRGLGKDESFSIGMPEHQLHTKWTAVHVDQEWRLSHIQWAMDSRQDENQNMTKDNISDFYFLTDPDDFAYFCHPDDFNWQLLDRPYSKKEFLAMPNFRPVSFFMDMAVLNPKHSTTKTARPYTEIEIALPKKLMEDIEVSCVYKFHQELAQGKNNEVRDSKTKLPKKLGAFVFVNRKSTKFIFEIQLPASGKYLVDIYAKHFNKDKENKKAHKTSHKYTEIAFERLVQFRLISDLDPAEGDIEPLPDVPEHGWGPGPSCRQLGLVPLTHFDSYIFIKPGEFRDIRFRLKNKRMEVQCQLTHHFLPIYQLVEQIEQEIVNDEVHIRVRIPEEGVYALKIYTRPKDTKEFHEACVYLLKQQVKSRLPEGVSFFWCKMDPRQGQTKHIIMIVPTLSKLDDARNFERGYRRKYRDKMIRSRLEHHTENHTTEKELIDAIEMYHCYNVPDHGELKRANVKLKEYWEVKRELTLAIRGRNITHLSKWLGRARRSKYKDDLHSDILKAESLEESMKKRKGYAHPIAKMDEHTITEIHNYKRPPKVVHDVMKATYLLLGEDKEYLHIWEHIQYLMGRTGKDGLKKIIMIRQVDDVSVEQADEAELIILPYNIDKCRAVSSGIGSFYKWCCQFILEVKQHHRAQEQRVEELWAEQQRTKGIQLMRNDSGNALEGDLINETITSGESVSIKGMSPEPKEEQSQSDNIKHVNATQVIGHEPSQKHSDTGSISSNQMNDINDDIHKEITTGNQNIVDISLDKETVNRITPGENIHEDITDTSQEDDRELLVLNLDKRRSPSHLQDVNGIDPYAIKENPPAGQ